MKLDRRKLGKRRWIDLQKGDWVWTLQRPEKIGKFTGNNGGYYYVQHIDRNGIKYTSEHYRIELAKATDEEVTLWMLEN